jgi:hypothetical protein
LREPPPNAPPIGAGGSATGEWYEPIGVAIYRPGQRRSISRRGGSSSVTVEYINRGMERQIMAPAATGEATIAAPGCTQAGLWEQAIAGGAPASAVAVIEYTAEGYAFSITGTSFRYRFGTDCRAMEN